MVSAFLQISERCKLCTEKNFKLYTGNGPVEVTFLNEDGSRLRVSMGNYLSGVMRFLLLEKDEK